MAQWGEKKLSLHLTFFRHFSLFRPSFSPFFPVLFLAPCVSATSLCASLRLSARMSLSASSLSLFFSVSLSLCFLFSPLFFRSLCVCYSSMRLSASLCASLRVSGVGSLHLCIRFFAFYDFMRLFVSLCVFLRLSASLFIYLLFAFFPPFYRLFFCVPCVSALSRSAPLSGATMMMTITSFVRKMAPLEYLAPLSGATMR